MQKVKENAFHAFEILLSESQERTLRTSSKFTLRYLGSVAALFIAAFIGLIVYLQSEKTFVKNTIPLPTDKPSVLAIPFENQTGKSDNDFIGF